MKLVGCTLLFLSALYYSMTRQKQEKTKLTILGELCDLFGYLQKNIECFSSPLGDLYRSYTSPVLSAWGFYQTWQEDSPEAAVDMLPSLSADVRKVLVQYGAKAGQGYKEDEMRLCRYTREVLTEELEKQRQESGGKRKMYRTMPFLLVLSIVLLFL